MTIKDMNDIKELKEKDTIKYINLNLNEPNLEVIYYLLENGEKYLYSEKTEDKSGYIYVSYDIFKQAELFILEVINNISIYLNELEISRYLYITIGKNISYDINILPDKNDTFNLKNNSIVNNIWGSIYYGKGTNISLTKLYLYLCKLVNVNCKLITTSKNGYQKNMLTIQNRNITVDITQDIPYIQGCFKTKNFIGYNDNKEIDKKIGYIKDNYTNDLIEKNLKNIDSNEEELEKILNNLSNTINISALRPIELTIILEEVFTKYYPNYDIKMHNLYRNNYPNKEHFILISYKNILYSFNYNKNMFIQIEEKQIIDNMKEEKIGIYLNEKLPFITKTAIAWKEVSNGYKLFK